MRYCKRLQAYRGGRGGCGQCGVRGWGRSPSPAPGARARHAGRPAPEAARGPARPRNVTTAAGAPDAVTKLALRLRKATTAGGVANVVTNLGARRATRRRTARGTDAMPDARGGAAGRVRARRAHAHNVALEPAPFVERYRTRAWRAVRSSRASRRP